MAEVLGVGGGDRRRLLEEPDDAGGLVREHEGPADLELRRAQHDPVRQRARDDRAADLHPGPVLDEAARQVDGVAGDPVRDSARSKARARRPSS